jgi:hypothetical protein
MTDDELTEIELAILAACEDAKAAGWRIVPRVTVDNWARCCCPIGAFGGPESPGASDRVRAITGLRQAQLAAFMNGFDGARYSSKSPFFAMGRRFRDRLESGEL